MIVHPFDKICILEHINTIMYIILDYLTYYYSIYLSFVIKLLSKLLDVYLVWIVWI